MWPDKISGLGNIVWNWIEGSAYAEKPPVAKQEARGEPSFFAPIFDLSSLLVSNAYAAPAPAPQDPAKHWALLQRNWDRREKLRQKVMADTLKLIDQSLGLVQADPSQTDSSVQRAKRALFTEARHANFQAENWLLLEAARKCVDMFFFTRGEDSYLDHADVYLARAVANADTHLSFDIYRFTWHDVFSPTIHPVEAYFELKLTQFQVLNLTNHPREALALGNEIEAELHSRRIIQAQRSNMMSAQGYLNRLYLLRGFAGLYNPEMPAAAALQSAQKARAWAETQYVKSPATLKAWGMNKKDLRYDILLSQVIAARLLIKLQRYDEARLAFQSLLKEPEAMKKFGGFLDIGLISFYGLLQIALITTRPPQTLADAAQKFSDSVDWARLEASPDFQESLGLLIRQENWASALADFLHINVSTFSEALGDYALYLGWPSLAPKDSAQAVSAVNLNDYPTPAAKLSLAMKLIGTVDIPFDQRAEIINLYSLLTGGGH